jgi:hypothetical protein
MIGGMICMDLLKGGAHTGLAADGILVDGLLPACSRKSIMAFRSGAQPRTATKLADALGVEPGVLMAPDRELAAAMLPLDKIYSGQPGKTT